jgi:hypothetical protein
MSPYRLTDPRVTLTMNNGAVFRPSLETGRMVLVRQQEPYRFANQEPPACPVAPKTKP